LTVDVSEGDLQGIAQRGYEGAASTDHGSAAQAVALLLTDSLLHPGKGMLTDRQRSVNSGGELTGYQV
jgi:hypothetical protein